MDYSITKDYCFASWTYEARLKDAKSEAERKLIERDLEQKSKLYFSALRTDLGMRI